MERQNADLKFGCICLAQLLSMSVLAQIDLKHSFLALGSNTCIVDEQGKKLWSYPLPTRDGWVLPNGDLLLTIAKCERFPGGGVVETTREGKVLFQYQGTQSEVNTSQKLRNGNILLVEAGPNPRVMELDPGRKVTVSVPLICQRTNDHMQSRMTRKLENGNYLVPQLLDKVVREYTPQGKIAWEVKTPHWPFTAIRLSNGNTLINCTAGNVIIEVDAAGHTVWQLSNEDLPEPLINDACGAQRLSNGNTVFTSFHIGPHHVKLIEVTPQKKVAWTFSDESPEGIHEFQILTTNSKVLEQPLWR